MASKKATQIWRRLAQWYGSKLSDQYGPTCPDEWVRVIDRANDDLLETAFQKVTRESPKFPPTLGEFEAALPRISAEDRKRPSVQERLSRHAVTHYPLCMHQLARPWSYYGPEEDFVSTNRKMETMRHPRVEGAVIPSCDPCSKPTFRVRLEDITESVVVAA